MSAKFLKYIYYLLIVHAYVCPLCVCVCVGTLGGGHMYDSQKTTCRSWPLLPSCGFQAQISGLQVGKCLYLRSHLSSLVSSADSVLSSLWSSADSVPQGKSRWSCRTHPHLKAASSAMLTWTCKQPFLMWEPRGKEGDFLEREASEIN